MTRAFSTTGYRALLEEFVVAGYVVRFFGDMPTRDSPNLILRHDVDLDLRRCAPLAEIEESLGLRSTFFVLLSSPFYNLFAEGSIEAVGRLLEAGHRVGLHFDPRSSAMPTERIHLELTVLSDLVGMPVTVFSLHRPFSDAADVVVPGAVNAYAPEYTERMAYSADSRGRWAFGHPLDSQAFADRQDFQLLTHPIWWSEPEPMSRPEERALAFAYERHLQIEADMASNLEPFRQAVAGRSVPAETKQERST